MEQLLYEHEHAIAHLKILDCALKRSPFALLAPVNKNEDYDIFDLSADIVKMEQEFEEMEKGFYAEQQ